MQEKRHTSLLFMLVSFTILFLCAQLALFFIHYNVSSLADSILSSSITDALLNAKVFIPILIYIGLQLLAYAIFIAWIYWLATSLGKQYRLADRTTYFLGLSIWSVAVCALLALNTYYYPHSFFAVINSQTILITSLATCVASSILVIINNIRQRTYTSSAIVIVAALSFLLWNTVEITAPKPAAALANKPNVIIIGLDSLRPDAINANDTPEIYRFLQTSHTFTNAYTPLARTYPAWMTLLTGLHPKHSGARANMIDPANLIKLDNLAKKLKSTGYFTVYGTDLPRFTDIDERYGFDRIMQPKSGLPEFILADLYDLPLNNLLLRLPGARHLFPYNYGNRTATITYDPDQFIEQVQASLGNRPQQPLFLAVHLCIAHWPHTFARDGASNNPYLDEAYHQSVRALDSQFKDLLAILGKQGLLHSSLIVLMSDHGVTLGEPNDRAISKDKYIGATILLPRLARFKLDHTPEVTQHFEKDYSISTSYGMGTDVLSLKQNQIVLAFKATDSSIKPITDTAIITLADIAPTILGYLHISPLPHIDGHIYNLRNLNRFSAPVFLETGDRFTSIEKNNISVSHVVKEAIGSYNINPQTGLLTINNNLLPNLYANKQRAILVDDWLLARYPQSHGYTRTNPNNLMGLKPTIIAPYYVLLNLKTGQWTLDLSSPFAKKIAPSLLERFMKFYGDEITPA